MRSLTTAVAAIICLLFAPATRADDTLSMPASMNQFVNWYLDHGACGTWIETGVTEAMWTGVPAGVRYTGTINMWYEPATGQLLRSHHWVTDDGRVLSTGSSLMYWDATKGAPVGSGSGYDQGKPYHGTSVLKGMNADTVVWEYTEQSGDTTRTYTVSDRYTGTNTCTSTVQEGKDGTPWTTTSVRANPGGDLMKATRMVGTWDQTLPDGRTIRREISWVADKRVLKQERTILGESGESIDFYLMFWDPVQNHIATLYLDGHGTVINGKVDSITERDGTVTIVSSHEGIRYGDLTMSTRMTQVVDDTTLTTTFQGMSLNDIRHDLSWSDKASVNTRVDPGTKP